MAKQRITLLLSLIFICTKIAFTAANWPSISSTNNTSRILMGGNPTSCDVTFEQGVVPYAGSQDNGTSVIQDDNKTILVENNGWKALPYSYTLTSNTRIEFDFRSTVEGEEHSFGMDDNLSLNSNRIKLYGTQTVAGTINDFPYTGSSNYEHFNIPIGQYYTGAMDYMYFVMDNDANASIGNSYFSNIQIFEDTNGNGINDECIVSTIFTVTHADDTNDANPGDGICADASGNCTFRAAVEEANANNNPTDIDIINFNIFNGLPINLSGSIDITEPVFINGYSDERSDMGNVSTCTIHTGLVEITTDGTYLGSALNINANNVSISGIYLHGFNSFGAAINVSANNDADNLEVFGNILSDNHIGVQVYDGGYSKIENNFIGLDDTYSAAGNSSYGLLIGGSAHNSVVRSNLVAFSTYEGIRVQYSALRTETSCDTINLNYVGTDCSEDDLGNTGDGIYIAELSGQDVFVQDNNVAFNQNGLRIYSPGSGNTCLSRNQTWGNVSSGIRGSSASYGNAPKIESVVFSGKFMDICISTIPNATVDLFTGDPDIQDSRTQEGKYYLSSLLDDGSGTTCHTIDMSTLPVCVYDFPVFDAVINQLVPGCGCVSSTYGSYVACTEGLGTCSTDCVILDPQIKEVICDDNTGEVFITIDPIASEPAASYTVSVNSGSIIGTSTGTYGTPFTFSYSGHTSPVSISITDNTDGACTYSFIENANCLNTNPDCFPIPLKTAACYFIPITEQEGYTIFQSITPNRVGDPIKNFITMGTVQNGTIIFYDHYEDGYETDPFVKTQASTEIWGDGDLSNGIAPGTSNDILLRGQSISLSDEVESLAAAGTYYGGRDKILSTGGLTMARLMYPSDKDTKESVPLFAGGVEVYATQEWGTTYELPFGPDHNVNDLFDYVGLSIMAQKENTVIEIDYDANGTVDYTSVLSAGESYLVNGTPDASSSEIGVSLLQGASIVASDPIQVNAFTGDYGATYELRWFNLHPLEQWSNSYICPVGTSLGYLDDISHTFVHLYNPNTSSININWTTEGNVAQPAFSLPAKSSQYIVIPESSGAHIYSNDGDFYAVATIDANGSRNSSHDWGFALIPEDRLYNQVVSVLFADGDDPFATFCRSSTNLGDNVGENSSPVWLTANHPTGSSGAGTVQVAVDFDGDGGPLVDASGTRYDSLITLNILESKRVYDPDGNQTGMRVWVLNNEEILLAAAWGQDPLIASPASPAMDFGYTISSGLAITAFKEHSYLSDNNNDDKLGGVDTVQFSILINNVGNQALNNILVLDTMPVGLAYVPNSASLETCSGTTPIVDQSGADSPYPLDEIGHTLTNTVLPGEAIKIHYSVVLDPITSIDQDSAINIAYIKDGSKTIKVEDEIELVPCVNITSVVSERTICNGEILADIPFTTNEVAPNSIRFIHSDSKITSSSVAYAASDVIDIIPITGASDTVRLSNIQDYYHDGGTEPDTVYIYAVLENLPSDPDCRPVGELMIIIRPLNDAACAEDCDDGIDNNNDGKIDYADDLCQSNAPIIGIVGSDPIWKCEKTDYTFEVINQQIGLTYSWDFGVYADTMASGSGPHTIQFDVPTNEIPVYPEVVLTSIATNYTVTDTMILQVRPLPQISRVDISSTLSCGGSDGELAFEITQDTSTCFQISIDDGVTWGANDETDFSNLTEGTYNVWIQYCEAECPVNYGPVELNAPYSLNLGDDHFPSNCPGTIVGNGVIGNDTIIGDTVLFSIVNDGTWGNVTIDAGGVFEYIPHTPTCGMDQFDYEICDLTGTCCATATVTLDFSDDTDPSMSNVPEDITVSCDELLPVPDLVSASDNCPNVKINVEEKDNQGEDGCSQYRYTLTRTWIAEDLCGNAVRDSQKIEVQDFTAPAIYRIYTLPGGQKLVAGVMENVNKNWKTITFPFEFDVKPLVFSQVVTTEDATPVTTRVRQVSTAQFELRLQEEEAYENKDHTREKVAWIAIEPGIQTTDYELNANTADLNELWSTINFSSSFNNTPAFFGAIQTFQDDEPAAVRYNGLSTGSVQLKVEEEASLDSETMHSLERVGYLAIDNIGSLTEQSGLPMGEVGSVSVDHQWKEVKTTHHYYNPVVVIGSLGYEGADPSTVRIRNVKPNSFEVRVEEWAYINGTHAVEDLSFIVIEGSIQLETGEFCVSDIGGLEIGKDIIAIDNCDPSVTIFYEEGEVINGANVQTIRTWYVEDECGNNNGYSKVVNCSGLAMQAKLILQGAEIDGPGLGKMRDDLRAKNLVPLEEPYSNVRGFTHVGGGGETCSDALMAVTGDDAIVDWVFIELRSVDNSDLVLSTFSALLQKDGDIMDQHGEVVMPVFNLPPGDYYVAIKHRNHVPIISLYPYTFSATEIPFIDFTDQYTPSRGNDPTVDVGDINTPIKAAWSGDLNGDEDVIFQGPGNDIFYMFLEILLDPGNEDKLTNFISKGYTLNDFNMDGTVIYQGPNNDKAALLWNTIFNHPDNEFEHPNFVVSTKRAIDNSDYQSCLIDPKQDPCDFDNDGLLNIDDFDDDNDGVADGTDIDAYDKNSDTDGDGISDLDEGNQGSNPLSACDPMITNANCVVIDKDQDNHYPNYPKNHSNYDEDDWNSCIPNLVSSSCNCPDPDQDGYVFICTGKTVESTGKTIKIKLTEWIPRQALGDTCGPCQE